MGILEIREPTKSSMNVIIHFSKCTGDYNHLSLVDLQLLALLYELEEEGCGVNNMNHIRYEPKNVIGKGKIELLLQKQEEEDNESDDDDDNNNNKKEILREEKKKEESQVKHVVVKDDKNIDDMALKEEEPVVDNNSKKGNASSTWAHIVNPVLASYQEEEEKVAEDPHSNKANYTSKILSDITLNDNDLGGQFSDAEEEEEEEEKEDELEKELKLDFPSLSASLATAVYSSDDNDEEKKDIINPLEPTSTKRYNSFRTFGNVVTSKGCVTKSKNKKEKKKKKGRVLKKKKKKKKK